MNSLPIFDTGSPARGVWGIDSLDGLITIWHAEGYAELRSDIRGRWTMRLRGVEHSIEGALEDALTQATAILALEELL